MPVVRCLVYMLLTGAATAFDAPSRVLEERAPATCTTTAASRTQGYICDEQGKLKNPQVVQSTTANSQTACRTFCFSQPYCVSFSYQQSNGLCKTYTNSLVSQDFTQSQSGVVFWNAQNCFDIKCTCPAGLKVCGENCADLSSDPGNCGKCFNACPSAATCTGGTCTCPIPSQSLCFSNCVNTNTDNSNCGSCGIACQGGTSCTGGVCICSDPSETLCGPNCVNLSNDAQNCGGCGNICPSDQYCSGGSCTCSTPGDTLCGTTCYGLTSDNNNCGFCSNACLPGTSCVDSACQCDDPALTNCGGNCVDLTSDANNCGQCFNNCGGGQSCIDSNCVNACGTVSTCAEPQFCGSNDCFCLDAEGSTTQGYCASPPSYCPLGFEGCSSNEDCPPNFACALLSCCNFGFCYQTNNGGCENGYAARNIFKIKRGLVY